MFFVGLALSAVMCLLKLKTNLRLANCVVTVLALVGGIVVALSATPIHVLIQAIWGALLIAALVILNRDSEKMRKARVGLAGALLVCSLILAAIEIPYRSAPPIHMSRDQVIYVIGDSISAGCGGDITNWPEVLAEKQGLSVANLALAGATVKSALRQADGIVAENAVVILEIGGNDLLGRTTSQDFGIGLEQLLAKVSGSDRRIVMFELPLFPFGNRFGQHQRKLAKQFNVLLIPKRYMAHVIGAPDATMDGLHLSQHGQNLMAETVWDLMETIDR